MKASPESHVRIVHSLDDVVRQNLSLLKPTDELWQPSDFIPDSRTIDFDGELLSLARRVAGLSDETLIAFIGNAITEEALPSYQTAINRNDSIRDETGISESPWSSWSRGWTAEEKRHGSVMAQYLLLSRRVNMHAVEKTIHNLLRNGFSTQDSNDPYQFLMYTAFQERATRISHTNTGKLANKEGDEVLAKICANIGADESRHEQFYKRAAQEIFNKDTHDAMLAFKTLLDTKIVMPARFMDDGTHPEIDVKKNPWLFNAFSLVTQKAGVYTAKDYASIISELSKVWGIADKSVQGDAAKAQDYICSLPARYEKLAEREQKRIATMPTPDFSWLLSHKN